MARGLLNSHPDRRWFCTGALVAGLAAPRMARSGGGGGGRDETTPKEPSYRAGRGPVVKLSARQVSRMSGQAFTKARDRARKNGKVLLVEGYDLNMTELIEKLMNIDHQSAGTLLRDMRRLHTQEKRVARIEEEQRYQMRLIHAVEDNISELNAKNTAESKAEVAKELDRIKRATRFRRLLRRWERWELDPKRGRTN